MAKGKKPQSKACKIDLEKETQLDWECSAKFNKLIWGKWPKSVGSMTALCEWLEKKGYVVRWQVPMSENKMHTTRWLVDLAVDESGASAEIFRPQGKAPEDEKLRNRLIGEWRQAQRSHLVCTSCLRESNGGGTLFALFRESGTTNCMVFVTWQVMK